jgi:hypothetical protein
LQGENIGNERHHVKKILRWRNKLHPLEIGKPGPLPGIFVNAQVPESKPAFNNSNP